MGELKPSLQQKHREEVKEHSSALNVALVDRDKVTKDVEALGESLWQEASFIKK